MCFVDLEKAYGCVPLEILCWVLWEYEVLKPLGASRPYIIRERAVSEFLAGSQVDCQLVLAYIRLSLTALFVISMDSIETMAVTFKCAGVVCH